jgi:hypothetical protein
LFTEWKKFVLIPPPVFKSDLMSSSTPMLLAAAKGGAVQRGELLLRFVGLRSVSLRF